MDADDATAPIERELQVLKGCNSAIEAVNSHIDGASDRISTMIATVERTHLLMDKWVALFEGARGTAGLTGEPAPKQAATRTRKREEPEEKPAKKTRMSRGTARDPVTGRPGGRVLKTKTGTAASAPAAPSVRTRRNPSRAAKKR